MTTAREKARAAATDNGWAFRAEEMFIDEYKKGRRYVRVQADVQGRITFASTPKKYIYGKDKLARVLELLTEGTAK